MTGSSSTWYAINARCSVSHSSAARFAGSEDGKQLLRRIDDRVRCLALEPIALMDPPPGDRDREHAGRFGRAHVEWGVAHVGGLARVGIHALRTEEKRLGVGLVLLRLVAADHCLEEVREGHARECELDGRAPLGRDDAEPAAFLVEADEHVLHPETRFELLVQRLIVRAIDAYELLDA